MTSDRVCKNCDYGLYASTGCGFYPPDREKGCEHFKPKCDDRPIGMNDIEKAAFNPLNYPEECQLYGSWMSMGQISEDWLIATISEATKRLLEQMHDSVEPLADITLIFKLNPTEDNNIFSVTGAWRCYGKQKERTKRDE